MHLEFLEPLNQWKIMLMEKLFSESQYSGNYKHFQKVLRKLEKKGIIQGFRDLHTRKKFIYATELGSDLISEDSNISPNSNSMVHDAKVSEVVYELRNYKKVNDFELEHIYRGNTQFMPARNYDKYYPDAVIKVLKKDKEEKIAVELELTQKAVGRIQNKFYRFVEGNDIETVLYLFCNKRVMRKYIEVYKERFEGKHTGRFIFYCDPNVLTGKQLFNDPNCFYSFKNYHQFTKIFGQRLEDDLVTNLEGDKGV